MNKHVTIRVQLVSHFDFLSLENIQYTIQPCGTKVLLYFKRDCMLESKELLCRIQPTGNPIYLDNHTKIAAFENHMKKHQSSVDTFWYEQMILLPIQCEQQFHLKE